MDSFDIPEPNNHLLQAMVQHGAIDLGEYITRNEKAILSDIQRMEKQKSENGEEDKPLKFSIALKVEINLDKHVVNTGVSHGLKSSAKEKHLIKDPNEPELPFTES